LKNSELTQARLKDLLDYDSTTGVFTWRVKPPHSHIDLGSIAGCEAPDGYVVLGIDGHYYKSHRLAWLYSYGHWPNKKLDHINGARNDNRLINLRLATSAENCRNARISKNNKSGFKGVHWNKASGKWRATCKAGEKPKYLGSFDTAEAAATAYRNYAMTHHGEFFRP
jgi:hypothetical protein